MATTNSVKKVQVVLVRSKSANGTSDISKMTSHLEGLLIEKEGVDLKVRASLTDAVLKGSDYVVFCGYDLDCLSDLFKALSFVETAGNLAPTLFLYEEPGQSIREEVERIIVRGMDLRRISPSAFGKIVDSWTYRDIVGTVDQEVRRRSIGRNPEDTGSAEGPKAGDPGQDSGV
jgi:hypothetical protein